jgi:hypothetical protein
MQWRWARFKGCASDQHNRRCNHMCSKLHALTALSSYPRGQRPQEVAHVRFHWHGPTIADGSTILISRPARCAFMAALRNCAHSLQAKVLLQRDTKAAVNNRAARFKRQYRMMQSRWFVYVEVCACTTTAVQPWQYNLYCHMVTVQYNHGSTHMHHNHKVQLSEVHPCSTIVAVQL